MVVNVRYADKADLQSKAIWLCCLQELTLTKYARRGSVPKAASRIQDCLIYWKLHELTNTNKLSRSFFRLNIVYRLTIGWQNGNWF